MGSRLGLGVNWARPGSKDPEEQWSLETFYKFQVTETFAITPDVQLIVNPPLNPDENVIAIFGLRARINF